MHDTSKVPKEAALEFPVKTRPAQARIAAVDDYGRSENMTRQFFQGELAKKLGSRIAIVEDEVLALVEAGRRGVESLSLNFAHEGVSELTKQRRPGWEEEFLDCRIGTRRMSRRKLPRWLTWMVSSWPV